MRKCATTGDIKRPKSFFWFEVTSILTTADGYVQTKTYCVYLNHFSDVKEREKVSFNKNHNVI